jgi:prepilin-type N-terminal cleavage/methylation domain-containing protein
MRRGFTLIEVMMAAGIIGIGLLGLIAMLAGAARVQQTSSQTSESVLVAKNAEAMLRQSLAGIVIDPTAPLGVITEGQWYVVPKDDEYDHLELTGLIWPVAESTEPTPLAIYQREFNNTQAAATIGQAPYVGNIKSFAHRDLVPETVAIRVVTAEIGAAPDYAVQNTQEFVYTRPGGPDWPGYDAVIEPNVASPGSNIVTFYRDGDALTYGLAVVPNTNRDFININIEAINQGGTVLAAITGFRILDIQANLGSNPQRVIESISIEQTYRYRNRRLISLQDRITYAKDETRADGRRPKFGFSVMYRTLASGASQAGVMMYGLQAPSRNALWNPMETGDDSTDQIGNGLSPVVEVGQGAPHYSTDVDLGFDGEDETSTHQYYIEVDSDFDWVVAPEQILLVSWADSVSGGADDAVRVVRREVVMNAGNPPSPTGKVRGYLDRGPRFGNQAMLGLNSGAATTTESVDVWVVKDVAQSDEDTSMWRLRPLRFIAFQLDG